ncbi:MAG: NAD(P)-dependent oxidoreductase [Desulfobacteraceae bacterium]
MKTVALTGATGFIGSHVARALIQTGHPLHLYVRRTNPLIRRLQRQGARVFVGTGADDVPMLRKALEEADTVIHCAAAIKAMSRRAFYQANVAFTERVLSLSGRHQRFLFISSQAAVGPSPGGVPLDETARPAPVNAYGWSKLRAERIIRAWGREHDRRYLILRPSVVYGPGEKDVFLLFKGIRKGVAFLPGNGRQRVSFLHVDDLVGAILAALERKPKGETFFVTGDEPASWLELAWLIQTALSKHRILTLRLPVSLTGMAAFFADALSTMRGKPAIFCRDKVLEMRQESWLCSNRRIEERLSWKPQVSLREGVEKTAAWYLDQHWI